MVYDIRHGIENAKRIVKQHNIQGVHGTLIELLDCMDSLHTAVEVEITSSSQSCFRKTPADHF